MIEAPLDTWVTGQLALALLAVDPHGLKGVHLRARAGPVRDACLAGLPHSLGRPVRIAPSIADTQLFGGIDISATLSSGKVISSAGLIGADRNLILTMAERCELGLAARLAQVIDAETLGALIVLDEGADADERAPAPLTERLAFSLDLDGLRAADLADIALEARDIDKAREILPAVEVPEDGLSMLVVAAARFGIDSLRAPLLAMACARAHAALSLRKTVQDDDLTLAAQLVYAHRATMIPDAPEETADTPEPPDPSESETNAPDQDDMQNLPEEMLIDAVKALLPPEILLALTGGKSKGGSGSGGAGARRKGNRRGRPLPSRPGRLDGGNRIDIVATLRAAAPWQPIRRKAQPDAKGLLIRPSDIHVRRYQDLSDRLIIFAVDASGSSAMTRLAEAKGAVELMLGEAYARRDHVALIAFRGEDAQVILPPTRSLVQTKRLLAGLPGGGGTPLAAGLQQASELARQSLGQGLSPSLAVLTDGRANVPLPGKTGRAAAAEDAKRMAQIWQTLGLPSAVVDTGNRPTRDLAALAQVMGGTYVPLPRADARGLSQAIGTALER